MRRGFLKTPRPPPKPQPQQKPSSPPRRTQDGSEETATAEDAMDVEMTAVEDVSNEGNRVIAVRTTRLTEGEAEQPSFDDHNDIKSKPPSKDPPAKGKGKEKEKVADTGDDPMHTSADDASFIPPRPFPRRPGWGRNPDEDFFHKVPKSHGGPHIKRAVFRLWPRDPNGKVLMPSEQPRGTLSPDGYPWGATLYDFYNVNRIPAVRGAISIMTGSALWEAMKELGELDAARPEIEWAESEGKPRAEGVANTVELIESVERRLQLRAYCNFSMLDDVQIDWKEEVEQDSEDEKGDGGVGGDEDHDEEDEDLDDEYEGHDDGDETPEDGDEEQDESEIKHDDMKVDPASIPPPPTIPITSPFHPSHYPKPWPFIPFKNPLSILLQERIPLYLLPQTLYVHDPFGLLPARERRFSDTSWMSRPDTVRTYNLKVSETVRKEVEEARQKAEELEVFKSRTLVILRYMRTKEQIKNHEPVIEVPLPPYPRRMTKVGESHLYLSPVAKVGNGHHSIVYQSEWELPRDLFAGPKLCRRCFEEAADKEIQRLKDTGRWKKMLKAAAWGPTGFTGRQPTQAELAEVSDSVNLERDGEIIEREITCIVPSNASSPSQVLQILDESDIWGTFMKEKSANALHLNFTQGADESEDEGGPTKDPYVATIRIDPPFSYESQKTCTHGSRPFAIPRTAKFTVVAKLSIENDPHLRREARNYQQFPEHFFHHYNGYTLVGQLRTIVPVNAVVPQFYGYYTPKQEGKEDKKQEPYLSPILLLEHCGQPIEPEKLSLEDQDECASLLLRFQRAGWLHESVAPRNFLVQFGKPTEFPIARQANPEPSFRLIDFGRSRKFETAGEKRMEEMEASHMFEKLNGKMSVTLSM